MSNLRLSGLKAGTYPTALFADFETTRAFTTSVAQVSGASVPDSSWVCFVATTPPPTTPPSPSPARRISAQAAASSTEAYVSFTLSTLVAIPPTTTTNPVAPSVADLCGSALAPSSAALAAAQSLLETFQAAAVPGGVLERTLRLYGASTPFSHVVVGALPSDASAVLPIEPAAATVAVGEGFAATVDVRTCPKDSGAGGLDFIKKWVGDHVVVLAGAGGGVGVICAAILGMAIVRRRRTVFESKNERSWS